MKKYNKPVLVQTNKPQSVVTNRKSKSPTNFTRSPQTPQFDMSELLFNINDDHSTLINKNNKLRNLIVQASGKITELNTKMKEREEEFRIEKAGILDELDKIIANYKFYADGFKNYSSLQAQFKNLQKDYQHNYNVMTSYQGSLSVFLRDYMNLFQLITVFMSNKYTTNPLQFLYDIKELIYENMLKYRDTIDILNFADIYEDYNQIIENKSIAANQKGSSSSINNNQPSNSSRNLHNTGSKKQNSIQIQKSPSRLTSGKSKATSYTSGTVSTNNKSLKNQRQESVDNLVDKKIKCIQKMESHIKNYFDQPNTQNEIKDSTQAINFNFDKANQNLKPSGYPNNDNQAANVLEETPQFDDRQMVSLDKNIIKGCVVQDYETTKEGDLPCKCGERVEIISIDRTNGFLYIVDSNGDRGLIPESYVEWEDNY